MKKLFLVIALMVTSMVANAQFYVGGGISFWDNNDAETTTYSISPEVGYCFSEKLAVGLSLEYAKAEIADKEASAYAISPYARYTFFKAGVLSLFADGTFEFINADNGDDSDTGWGIGIKPGISIAMGDRFSAVAHLGFLGYRDADEIASNIYTPGAGFDLSNTVSFSLYYSF